MKTNTRSFLLASVCTQPSSFFAFQEHANIMKRTMQAKEPLLFGSMLFSRTFSSSASNAYHSFVNVHRTPQRKPWFSRRATLGGSFVVGCYTPSRTRLFQRNGSSPSRGMNVQSFNWYVYFNLYSQKKIILKKI